MSTAPDRSDGLPISVSYTKAGAKAVIIEIPEADPFRVMERVRARMFHVEQPADAPTAQAQAIAACLEQLARKKGFK